MAIAINFTKAALEKLPAAPTGTRTEYSDTGQDGLRLRVTDKGKQTYCVLGRLKGGGMERLTLGSTVNFTPSQARMAAKDAMAKLARGESLAAAGRAKRGEMTLGELVKTYLDRRPMKPRSRTEAADILRRYIEPALGKLKLSDVTKDKVSRLHSSVTRNTGFPAPDGTARERGAPVTANRCLSVLKAAYNWARDDAGIWTGDNPVNGIKKNPEASRERYLLATELERFFAALETLREPGKSFFTLALFMGGRKLNTASMRWQDLDLDAGLWRLPDTKPNVPMTVPLPVEALEVLRARRADAAPAAVFVFPGPGVTGHYVSPKRAWQTLKKRSGLTDLRIHDLRRSLGSWMVHTGANTAINAKALGHKSMQAAAVYQRVADAHPINAAMNAAVSAMLIHGGLKTAPSNPASNDNRQ